MTITQSLVAYSLAAGLLTITPGLDTALVLRTAAIEGARSAALAGVGIVTGCLVWGSLVALGLGALLAASVLAFSVLKWAGALYLLWLGVRMILRPRSNFATLEEPRGETAGRGASWLRRGLLTNLLNPKVGVFYVSFLPQFLPAHVAAGPYILLLAVLHAMMGLAWFAALILGTRPLARLLRRPRTVQRLDRAVGLVFVCFGVKLAMARR